MAEALGTVHTREKGTTSMVIVASRPKIILSPNGSTIPGKYGWLFVYVCACVRAHVHAPLRERERERLI
jgi:hypothetical protein